MCVWQDKQWNRMNWLSNGSRVHFNLEDFCNGAGSYITNEFIIIDVNLLWPLKPSEVNNNLYIFLMHIPGLIVNYSLVLVIPRGEKLSYVQNLTYFSWGMAFSFLM